jgi:hypothetical protein
MPCSSEGEVPQGEIDQAGFEPQVEVLQVAVDGLDLHLRRFGGEAVEQDRQHLDGGGIHHEDAEFSVRGAWIEGGVVRAQRAHAFEDGVHRRGQRQRLGGGLHAHRHAHE